MKNVFNFNFKMQSVPFFCFFFLEFKKRVLRLLTEIRNGIQQVGRKYEAEDSDFHLEKMTDLSAVEELEVRLLDDETKKLVVRY